MFTALGGSKLGHADWPDGSLLWLLHAEAAQLQLFTLG